jgi:hypothetical protein
MRRHAAVAHVAARGASALRNLMGCPAHAARLGEAGGVGVLCDALGAFASAPEVAAPLLGALRNACTHAPNAARAGASGAPAALLSAMRCGGPGVDLAGVFAAANLCVDAGARAALATGGLGAIMDAIPPGTLTVEPAFAKLRAGLRAAAPAPAPVAAAAAAAATPQSTPVSDPSAAAEARR